MVISDGALWIRNIVEELFPNAIMILDLFHLIEKVYTFASGKFPFNEKDAKIYAKDIADKLEEGRWKEVLSSLDPKEEHLSVNLYSYIDSNKDRIDYPLYRSKGYFVGSGAIESGNKVVMQKRMKLAGMRWSVESAQYLLSLRAKFESKNWVSEVEAILSEQHPINGECLRIPRK